MSARRSRQQKEEDKETMFCVHSREVCLGRWETTHTSCQRSLPGLFSKAKTAKGAQESLEEVPTWGRGFLKLGGWHKVIQSPVWE